MNQIIMYIMAFGVILGSIDRIFGNRGGYGKKMEEGFLLMGPLALSMAGIICLAPTLAKLLGVFIIPIYKFAGIDPGMFGSFFSMDMGGYQMAVELAVKPELGRYSGVVVAATFGCTVLFLIPVGMEMVRDKDRPFFIRGIMIGLVTLPVGLITGGLLQGLSLLTILHQNLFVLAFSLILFLGFHWFPNKMLRVMELFSKGIKCITTIGLLLGAVSYMTGFTPLKEMVSLPAAMEIVASTAIMMLGSLPISELISKLLRRPLTWLGNFFDMNGRSVVGLLVCSVSVVPAIIMLKDMDKNGKVINVAFMVCAASTLAAHLGFVYSVDTAMMTPLLVSKLCGGFAAAAAAVLVIKKRKAPKVASPKHSGKLPDVELSNNF